MKKVFLIFANEDAWRVNRLLPSLDSPEYELEFYDGPLDMDIEAPGSEAVKQTIGEKVVKCGIAVCLISESASRSKWVDLQLRKNLNKGNRIIAMAVKGVESAVLPELVRQENLTFYPWDPARLKKMIGEEEGGIFDNSPK
ncbi:MAG: TIR domain-containing protein [Candidatus Omnitrophica bacterium]|jgi:hypothetical protein|nr:TIR domain-containing protein [Candidatus Omnitrophota bacterium]MDD5078316.1 TIR domain-containing protein [Candidatus Omnitrophota bacterium]MDD5725305.1 TIR domain-containing protein [Candidatus Omnitrophota bacterium]